MPKKLVRRGRVRGYRPTREELEEILELTQRGINENAMAKLAYSKGAEEIYSQGVNGRILPEDFGQVVSDAGDPDELNNLYLSISQDSPIRRVEIEIGPGDWTRYSIESDDQTWAHGRYFEITEKLLADRSLYAKGCSSTPQVPKEGTDVWRSAAWELVSNWRAGVLKYLTLALWSLLVVEIGTILVALSYYDASYTDPQAARNDRYNANLVLSWFRHNSGPIVFVNLSYILMTILLDYWLRKLLESKVILRSGAGSFFSQLGFRRNRNDTVQLVILYLTFGILIVSFITLLVPVINS